MNRQSVFKASLSVGRFLAGMAVAGLVALTVSIADRQHNAVVALHGQVHELRALGDMLETTVRIMDPHLSVDRGTGSGVVVGIDRSHMGVIYVITNHHVADHFYRKRSKEEGPATLVVELFTGERTLEVEPLFVDKDTDLALLRVHLPIREVSHIHPAILCSSSPTRLANPGSLHSRVYAVGAGLGLPPFITEGRVTNAYILDQMHEKGPKQSLLQHTALLISGNSGGGLYSITRGGACLVGINFAAGATIFGPVSHVALAIKLETVEKKLAQYPFIIVHKEKVDEHAS